MHYLLFYEKAADYAARQGPLQSAHRAHLSAAVRRGELLLAGSLADPFVLHGVVSRWWVREWQTVLGDGATAPASDPGGDPARAEHPPDVGQ